MRFANASRRWNTLQTSDSRQFYRGWEGWVRQMGHHERLLPDSSSALGRFCRELISKLDSVQPLTRPDDERELEFELLERRVVEMIKRPKWVDVRRHPWGRRAYEEGWAAIKEAHCADIYGTRHTADMYIVEDGTASSPGGISIDVKLAKMEPKRNKKTGKITVSMPNQELQTLVGQCLLSSLRHDYSIGVFGHLRPLHTDKWKRDTLKLEQKLARFNIYLVLKDLSKLPRRSAKSK